MSGLRFFKGFVMLTAKQEKFCQGVVKGLSYSDAYREAYDAEKMKLETVNRKAKELADNGKIAARLSELRGKIEEELIYSAKESFEKLKNLQDKAEAEKNINAAIKAEELKGKLAGIYVEKKDVVLRGNVNVMPSVKINGSKFVLNIGEKPNAGSSADS